METDTLTVNYTEEPGNNGFTGWVEEIRGIVAYGETMEELKKEVVKLIKVKISVQMHRMRNRMESISEDDLTLA